MHAYCSYASIFHHGITMWGKAKRIDPNAAKIQSINELVFKLTVEIDMLEETIKHSDPYNGGNKNKLMSMMLIKLKHQRYQARIKY